MVSSSARQTLFTKCKSPVHHVLCLFLSCSSPAHILHLLERTVIISYSQTQGTQLANTSLQRAQHSRHLTKSNICLFPISLSSRRVPWRRNASIWGFMPTSHRSRPAAPQRRCHGGTMKRSAELDSMQNYYFERFDGLDFGERICRPSLSKQTLQFVCFGSRLGFVVCVCSGSQGITAVPCFQSGAMSETSFWDEDATCSEFKICH